jgi:hypothetical protein
MTSSFLNLFFFLLYITRVFSKNLKILQLFSILNVGEFHAAHDNLHICMRIKILTTPNNNRNATEFDRCASPIISISSAVGIHP